MYSVTRTSVSANSSATSGGMSRTCRLKLCSAIPSVFVAVTMTVAMLARSPVNVSVVPSIAAVAAVSGDTVAM